MELKINIKRCFYDLWKKKNLIGMIVLLSILLGLYSMLNIQEVGNYCATASVYHNSIVYGAGINTSSSDSSSGGEESAGGLEEFSEISTSTNVAKRAAALLDKEGITEENIGYLYTTVANGNFLYINSYADDRDLAVGVANAVAEAFSVEYKNLTGVDSIQVFEKAETATYYKGDDTNKKMTLIIFTGVGLFLVCVIIVMRLIFSAKIQDYSECSMDGRIEILGVIPEVKE